MSVVQAKCYEHSLIFLLFHRITEWCRLEGTSGGCLSNPPAEAGAPRPHWPGTCPDDF